MCNLRQHLFMMIMPKALPFKDSDPIELIGGLFSDGKIPIAKGFLLTNGKKMV